MLTDLLRRAAAWFTDGRRQAIQVAFVAVLSLLVSLDFANSEQANALAALSVGVLQLAQGLIGLALLKSSDAYAWFDTAGRRIIYAVAAALGPVGIAFGLWGDHAAAQIVTVVSLAVSVLSAFVQVVNVQTRTPALALGGPTPVFVSEDFGRRVLDHAERNPATFKRERLGEWPLTDAETRSTPTE